MDKPKNYIEVIRFSIYIVILILGLGSAYGAINNRLTNLEDCTQAYKSDHNLIIMLNVKMDNFSEILKEVKADVKELKRR